MHSIVRPYFCRKYLLTRPERSFYELLCRIAHDHVVLAKVRLADLIDVNLRHRRWQANFKRVRSKHIDFVVCDFLFRPVVAIELDDAAPERAYHRERDAVVDGLFAAVQLPLARFPVRSKYQPEVIERVLLEKFKQRSET